MAYDLQNFYKQALLLDWSIGTGNFYVSTKPTVSAGWLVISPNNSTIREIVKYTATGTDSNGDYVTVSQRGVGGTTEQIHTQGEPIRMNITAEYWDDMNDQIAAIVASGVSNANTTTMGGVEIATQTEMNDGTDTGGTGASVVPTPSLINTKITASLLPIVNNFKLTIPLGESFTGATTPQPCVMISDIFQPKVTAMNRLGTSSWAAKYAVGIIPRSTVTSSTIYAAICKTGTPSDNIQITVQTDSSTAPSGTPITNGTSTAVTGASLSTSSITYQAFSFSSPFTLTAGTRYWIVFERTSSLSDTNYYYIGGDSASGTSSTHDYASFLAQVHIGSWSTGNGNNALTYFDMIPSSGSGSYSLWQSEADAIANNLFIKDFSGLCTTTGSAGASGTFYPAGLVDGFTGLIPYVDYYVSATKGAVTATNSGQFIGTSMSSTTIFIPYSNKIGSPISMLGQPGTSFPSTNAFNKGILRAPWNGTLVVTGNSAGVTGVVVTTADDSAITINTQVYSSTEATGDIVSLTIPIRKGQFYRHDSTSAGSTVCQFIPQY